MKKFTLFLGALLISMMSMAKPLEEGYIKVTDITTLSAGDKVVLYCDDTELGVTGWNGNKDAIVAYTGWVEYVVEATEGGVYLKDEAIGKYVLPAEKAFKYDATPSIACNVSSDGILYGVISDQNYYLYDNNGQYYRMYVDKTGNASYKPFYVYKVIGEGGGTTPDDGGETPDDGGETPDDGGETPANVTFDFTTKDGLEALGIAYPTTDAGNGACATDLEEGKAYSQNGISLTAKYGSTATRIWLAASGKLDLRHYKGGVLTFAAPSGKVITNIVFDGADVSGLTTLVDKAWTGNASTVEIPAAADAKTIKINTITVHVADASSDYVATPAISGETNFLENTTVTITAEEGLEVYYTLDGTDPTKASNKYTAPFELTATTTVKAIAYNGDKASAVVCKTFTKTPLIGCAEVNALANGEIAYMKPFDVVYVVEGAGYIYIKDETGNALIYSYDWDESTYFTPGDHVEGFIGKSSPYNGLPELKPNCNYEDLTITKGGTPTEPTILTEVPEAADVHKYVQFNGVKFKEDATFAKDKATNATMLVAEIEVVLRNAFKFETALMANKQYNVVGFVALYNDAVQVYFLKAEALSTAVDNITINQNATKFIENGQLVIVKDGVRYNVIGQVTK
ncbi:MAG: chitobiase/beta-hexosaminidase C-terminal domain-containing protein [Paludibacteraceae bacterium]|nr:chitobiase/beta-hexosaminidase C-terminal domain-containing protein [Paludibacteraceae bacterium]